VNGCSPYFGSGMVGGLAEEMTVWIGQEAKVQPGHCRRRDVGRYDGEGALDPQSDCGTTTSADS